MAQKPQPKKASLNVMQVALIGVVVALFALLLTALVRAPLHVPFYDTISSSSSSEQPAP